MKRQNRQHRVPPIDYSYQRDLNLIKGKIYLPVYRREREKKKNMFNDFRKMQNVGNSMGQMI